MSTEAQRKAWREKQRRKWARMDPDTRRAIWREKDKRKSPEAKARHIQRLREKYVPKPRQTQPRPPCAGCGQPASSPSGKYCSHPCYIATKKRNAHYRYNDPRLAKTSCPIRFANCRQCGGLFTLHGPKRVTCSDKCRLLDHRRWNREYQRRTRVTAYRYWRIADTPEADKLAQTYFLCGGR